MSKALNKELLKDLVVSHKTYRKNTVSDLVDWRNQNGNVEALTPEQFQKFTRLELMWEMRTNAEHQNKMMTIREHAKTYGQDERTSWNDWEDCNIFYGDNSTTSIKGEVAAMHTRLDRLIYLCEQTEDRKTLLDAIKVKISLMPLDKLDANDENKGGNTVVVLDLSEKTKAMFSQMTEQKQGGVVNISDFKERLKTHKFDIPFKDFEEINDDDDDIFKEKTALDEF